MQSNNFLFCCQPSFIHSVVCFIFGHTNSVQLILAEKHRTTATARLNCAKYRLVNPYDNKNPKILVSMQSKQKTEKTKHQNLSFCQDWLAGWLSCWLVRFVSDLPWIFFLIFLSFNTSYFDKKKKFFLNNSFSENINSSVQLIRNTSLFKFTLICI